MGIWSITFALGSIVTATVLSYPLVAYVRSRFRTAVRAPEVTRPVPISVVLPGHNEVRYVRTRIEGLLSDPAFVPGSEVIVVTGGNNDGMESELRCYEGDERVVLMIEHARVMKIAGLNKAVPRSRNEVLVFCDWRQHILPGSILRLVRTLAVPGIGAAVAGLADSAGTGQRSLYRRIVHAINAWDSHGGGCMNIHGACYALRRECFRPVREDLIFDDLFTVASVHAQGFGIVQVEGARFTDVSFGLYYGRERVERLARGLLLFALNGRSVIAGMPIGKRLRFLLLKMGKLILPFALLLTLPATVQALRDHPAAASVVAVLLLVLGIIARPLRTGVHFLFFTARAVVGFFLLNERSTQWDKLKRG